MVDLHILQQLAYFCEESEGVFSLRQVLVSTAHLAQQLILYSVELFSKQELQDNLLSRYNNLSDSVGGLVINKTRHSRILEVLQSVGEVDT